MKKLFVAGASCVAVCAIGAIAYFGYKVFLENACANCFEENCEGCPKL